MTKIFKQLARHWAACLAVAALLIVQAYCDLSLPDYTSKIVDVGIQQGGIESPVPDTVRDTTLQALELLMTEDEAALAAQWYSEPDADGLRYLSKDADTAAAELESAFTTPDVVLYLAAAQNAARVAGSTETVTPPPTIWMPSASSLRRWLKHPAHGRCCKTSLPGPSPSWMGPWPTTLQARPCCWFPSNTKPRASLTTCR